MEYDPNSTRQPGPVDSDLAAGLERAIRTIWTLLPEPLQVSVIVSLIDTLRETEDDGLAQREIRAALNEEGSMATAAYPVVEITRANLLQVGLNEEQIERLTDRQMLRIAGKMRTYFSHEDFWSDLETAAGSVLSQRETNKE